MQLWLFRQRARERRAPPNEETTIDRAKKTCVSRDSHTLIKTPRTSSESKTGSLGAATNKAVSTLECIDQPTATDNTARVLVIQRAIESTHSMLELFTRQMTELKEDKRKMIVGSDELSASKQKKLKKPEESIALKSALKRQYKRTLKWQMESLDQLIGKGDTDSSDSSSD